MPVHLWRIAAETPDYTADDLGGIGASKMGGRWNRVGEAVTYASESIALAAWETRAHMARGKNLPLNRFLVRLDVPDDVWSARVSAPSPLPVGWEAVPPGVTSINIGSAWLASGSSALLIVPSVIIHEESNVLINPAHLDAKRITGHKLRQFRYDPRV